LDEATSHLDGVTEERVNAKLADLRCTQIVIAHRLSTIRNADLILVLESGRIVAQGKHESRVSGSTQYATLIRAQESPNNVVPCILTN
jgi:ATP-binding cassette subfamily B protein